MNGPQKEKQVEINESLQQLDLRDRIYEGTIKKGGLNDPPKTPPPPPPPPQPPAMRKDDKK